jgi:glycosyltransferase involved in cell wall biosynthesis
MNRPLPTSKGRRALFVCPEPPYPIRGGGPLRTASLIEYARRQGEVDLIVFREPGQVFDRAAIAGDVLEIELPFHSRNFLPRVLRNVDRLARGVPPLIDRFAGYETKIVEFVRGRHYAVAILEHLWTAPYVGVLRPHTARAVLDLHNIESVLMRYLAPPFVRSARRAEAKWLPAFDQILVPSSKDQARVGNGAIVYPNAIPDRPMPQRAERFAVAMSGNFDYAPNRSGRLWFERRVWPDLAERFPGLEWNLIGKGAQPVEDAVAELATAQVAVAPIFAGSGTRLKILEAWAAGTPVVSTTLGAEGLESQPGHHLLLADTPETFRAAVAELLLQPDFRTRLRDSARELLHDRFTWPRAWERLEKTGGLY